MLRRGVHAIGLQVLPAYVKWAEARGDAFLLCGSVVGGMVGGGVFLKIWNDECNDCNTVTDAVVGGVHICAGGLFGGMGGYVITAGVIPLIPVLAISSVAVIPCTLLALCTAKGIGSILTITQSLLGGPSGSTRSTFSWFRIFKLSVTARSKPSVTSRLRSVILRLRRRWRRRSTRVSSTSHVWPWWPSRLRCSRVASR